MADYHLDVDSVSRIVCNPERPEHAERIREVLTWTDRKQIAPGLPNDVDEWGQPYATH
jgi:hypothetical protein